MFYGLSKTIGGTLSNAFRIDLYAMAIFEWQPPLGHHVPNAKTLSAAIAAGSMLEFAATNSHAEQIPKFTLTDKSTVQRWFLHFAIKLS